MRMPQIDQHSNFAKKRFFVWLGFKKKFDWALKKFFELKKVFLSLKNFRLFWIQNFYYHFELISRQLRVLRLFAISTSSNEWRQNFLFQFHVNSSNFLDRFQNLLLIILFGLRTLFAPPLDVFQPDRKTIFWFFINSFKPSRSQPRTLPGPQAGPLGLDHYLNLNLDLNLDHYTETVP